MCPDISMCRNTECTIKESCYRYTAIPSDYQAVANFKQVDGDCEYFWYNNKDHCKNVKKEGESCTLNNKCRFPNCNY